MLTLNLMSQTLPRSTGIAVQLARSTVACNSCFQSQPLTRAGIALPQPFAVGRQYSRGGIAVVGINPGASLDGGYKEARKRALDSFISGDDSALESYWDALSSDAKNYWNPKYLARLQSLGLKVEELLVGNIALCATAGNKYPNRMLRNCWSLHTQQFLEHFAPGVLVLMGSSTVMDEFVQLSRRNLANTRVVRIAHYAHREGLVYEAAECERVRAFLRLPDA